MGQIIYQAVVMLALLAGTASIIYTLPKVKDYWKGTYWLGLGLALLLDATFGLAFARTLGANLDGRILLYLLQASLAVVALELILVPYIHRKEEKIDELNTQIHEMLTP